MLNAERGVFPDASAFFCQGVTAAVTSAQERRQPVGSGAGQVQPGERVPAGGSDGGAGGLRDDAGGGAAALLQRSHGAVQNRSAIVSPQHD